MFSRPILHRTIHVAPPAEVEDMLEHALWTTYVRARNRDGAVRILQKFGRTTEPGNLLTPAGTAYLRTEITRALDAEKLPQPGTLIYHARFTNLLILATRTETGPLHTVINTKTQPLHGLHDRADAAVRRR